jgi:hypothetical protein
MTQPGQIPDQLVEDLRGRFSTEELVELTLRVMKYNIQKVMVALGTDVPVQPDQIGKLAWNADGAFVVAD